MDDVGNYSHNYFVGNKLSKTELFIGYPQAINHQFLNVIASSISTTDKPKMVTDYCSKIIGIYVCEKLTSATQCCVTETN